MISQKVTQYAAQHGYAFYVNGLGYRGTAQITTLGDKPQAVSRCSNNSKDALAAVNVLIEQRKLDAKSDDEIAIEAEQALADLLPPVVAIDEAAIEQAYQELQPVETIETWEQRHAQRFGKYTEADWALEHQSYRVLGNDEAQSERSISFPTHTYELMRY